MLKEIVSNHKIFQSIISNKRTFAEFFTNFSKYAGRPNFNDVALKCHLRYALCEKLSKQLVSINVKNFIYQQLVQECLTPHNQLLATRLNICKTSSRFEPSIKPARTLAPASTFTLPPPFK